MKPFLGIDVTADKKNKIKNGKEFIVVEPTSALKQALENSSKEIADIMQKVKLPQAVGIIRIIAECGVFFGVYAVVEALIEVDITFAGIYNRYPWFFWISGLCAFVWILLNYLSKHKEIRILESEEAKTVFSKADTVKNEVYSQFGIPERFETVDVLSFKYKNKNGETVPKTGLDSIFDNYEYKAYKEDGFFFLADLDNKYAFPLSELKKIHTVKKNAKVSDWHKEFPHNKGENKLNNFFEDLFNEENVVSIKKYHILELEHNGESWGIYFPTYELVAFEKLTGLTAEYDEK